MRVKRANGYCLVSYFRVKNSAAKPLSIWSSQSLSIYLIVSRLRYTQQSGACRWSLAFTLFSRSFIPRSLSIFIYLCLFIWNKNWKKIRTLFYHSMLRFCYFTFCIFLQYFFFSRFCSLFKIFSIKFYFWLAHF